MSTQAPATSVQASIVVEATLERAFRIFTEDIASWWPDEHHLLKDVAGMEFEPRVGGQIVDRAADGSECRWGRVLAYEPPHRVVFGWGISLDWQLEPDPARASEVEVRFVAEAQDRTRVEIEHRFLDRHGEGWQRMRDAVAGPNGWSLSVRRLSERLHG